jgi:hypothetical protein
VRVFAVNCLNDDFIRPRLTSAHESDVVSGRAEDGKASDPRKPHGSKNTVAIHKEYIQVCGVGVRGMSLAISVGLSHEKAGCAVIDNVSDDSTIAVDRFAPPRLLLRRLRLHKTQSLGIPYIRGKVSGQKPTVRRNTNTTYASFALGFTWPRDTQSSGGASPQIKDVNEIIEL